MFEWIEPSGTVGAPAEVSACYPDVDVEKYRGTRALLSMLPNGSKSGWVAQVFTWVGDRWAFVKVHGDVGATSWQSFLSSNRYPNTVIYRWDSPPADPPKPTDSRTHVFPGSNIKLRDCSAPEPKKDEVQQDQAPPPPPAEKKEGIGTVGYVFGAAAVGFGLWLIFK